MKKKSKMTKAMIAATFFITIIAIMTPVMAASSNRVSFMAIGDDLDINATNLIVGKMKFDKVSGFPSVQVNFHSKIYDEESGEKVYAMKGMLKDGFLLTTDFTFYCPIFEFWFIHVWQVVGGGKVKTTDTDYSLELYRNLFPITMPNTGGKYISAQILMLLSPKGEYYEFDPEDPNYPPGSDENPVCNLEQGGWVLAAVIWDVGIPTINVGFGPGMFPVGPGSYLTKYVEK
ncbi:MAG: hypothetical protein HWN79_14840 [Candidatus Lokiarchaeota archaeon]|nr:hypothetical protein [Candidatus Lokiarchaeota archaeon]